MIFTFLLIFAGLTLLSLAAGLFLMSVKPDVHQKYGNLLMRARLVFQGGALFMFVLYIINS